MPRYDLTPRQRAMMRLLALGHSNDEIAQALGAQLSTVRNNVAQVYRDQGLRNRVEAQRWMLEHDPELLAEVLADAPMADIA